MDHVNYFDTKTTYWIMRAEYLVGFVACVVLMLIHISALSWWAAIVLFFSIDVIGYYPGAIAYKRADGGEIHKGYYVIYNTMHNWAAAAAIYGLWWLMFGNEWAMMAIPLHICADRGVLGNTLRPFSVSFEPKPLPAFQSFIAQVTGRQPEQARLWADQVEAETSAV